MAGSNHSYFLIAGSKHSYFLMAGFEEDFWKIIRTYCLNDSNKEAYNIENTIGSIEAGTSRLFLHCKVKELMHALETMEDHARILCKYFFLIHIQWCVKYNVLNLLMVRNGPLL
jgi:hypothetical protein